jgi:hypothetical protein
MVCSAGVGPKMRMVEFGQEMQYLKMTSTAFSIIGGADGQFTFPSRISEWRNICNLEHAAAVAMSCPSIDQILNQIINEHPSADCRRIKHLVWSQGDNSPK